MERRKVLKKKNKGIINGDDKMAGLAMFIDDFRPVFYKNAVGSIDGSNFFDKLCNKSYKLYPTIESAKKALEEGTLRINEVYCWSLYDYHNAFPKLSELQTAEEVKQFLKDYNNREEVCIHWTFLDDDEVQELNEKAAKLKNRYYLHNY